MATVNFSKDEFASISFLELVSGYNSIALDELEMEEKDALMMFLLYAGQPSNQPDLNTDDVLLVKADSEGVLLNLYGPSIFRDENNNLILKCGANEFLVTQQGTEFKVGRLEGAIAFGEGVDITLKVDESEKTIKFYPAVIEFMPNDGFEIEYRVRCAWDASTEPQPPKIKALIKQGKSIAEFFRPLPSGSGSGSEAVRMQDLGKGVYEVEEARAVNTDNYGTRFILKLRDSREVWSRGNVDIQLNDRHNRNVELIRSGVVTNLIVSKCEQKADGKWSVTCTLRELPKAEIVGVEPPKQLAAAAVGAAEKSTGYDDIPF